MFGKKTQRKAPLKIEYSVGEDLVTLHILSASITSWELWWVGLQFSSFARG